RLAALLVIVMLLSVLFLLLLLLQRPISTLFPYTTLFRSVLWSLTKVVLFLLLIACLAVVADMLSDSGEALRISAAGLEFTLGPVDRKSTRLNSSHVKISYAVFCLKKKSHA